MKTLVGVFNQESVCKTLFSAKISSSKTYCIVLKEDVTPLVLHQEQEGEDGGEEDEEHADHHHQAAVKHPAKNPRGIMVNGTINIRSLAMSWIS